MATKLPDQYVARTLRQQHPCVAAILIPMTRGKPRSVLTSPDYDMLRRFILDPRRLGGPKENRDRHGLGSNAWNWSEPHRPSMDTSTKHNGRNTILPADPWLRYLFVRKLQLVSFQKGSFDDTTTSLHGPWTSYLAAVPLLRWSVIEKSLIKPHNRF